MINIMKALMLASDIHKNQIRKYNNEPYINHCIRVANNEYVVKEGEDAICIALLHDCLEDCEDFISTQSYIKENFNQNIFETCMILTHLKKDKTYNEYLQNIINSRNKLALLIKYSDSLDNSIIHISMDDKTKLRCGVYKSNSELFYKEYKDLSGKIEDADWDTMIALLARKRRLEKDIKLLSFQSDQKHLLIACQTALSTTVEKINNLPTSLQVFNR